MRIATVASPVIAAALLALSSTAFAQAGVSPAAPGKSESPMNAPTAKPRTPQQEKMAQCNADASGKAGDERKTFMKQCLSAKKTSQQDKMKQCNVDAAGKKGDERKAFMKQCLSS